MQFPSLSAAAPLDFARAELELRYDDLTQSGQIKLSSLHLVLGRVSFGKLWTRHPLFHTRRRGILPILTRLVLESDAVPVSFSAPVEGRGQLELAHEPAADGGVAALFMNSYGELWARPSRRAKWREVRTSQHDNGRDARTSQHANGRDARASELRDPVADSPPPELVRIGRAFGEHVFTRPFDPPNARRVLAFDVPGQPSVPPAQHRRLPAREALALPPGAELLDADFLPDEAPWVFGLVHTDANQHVNSLVYARLFEEAALRRLSRHGLNSTLIGRRIELTYRKPSFAGDRLYCHLRAYMRNHQPAAIGFLSDTPTPSDRVYCTFHLQFSA